MWLIHKVIYIYVYIELSILIFQLCINYCPFEHFTKHIKTLYGSLFQNYDNSAQF